MLLYKSVISKEIAILYHHIIVFLIISNTFLVEVSLSKRSIFEGKFNLNRVDETCFNANNYTYIN